MDAMLKPRTVFLEIDIDAMLKPRTVFLEIEIDSMLKPRTIHTEIKIKSPFTTREDFDDDFRIFSMSRSWLTFEIEYTEIKNALLSECTSDYSF